MTQPIGGRSSPTARAWASSLRVDLPNNDVYLREEEDGYEYEDEDEEEYDSQGEGAPLELDDGLMNSQRLNSKEDFEQAQLCFTYIKSIFDDLEDAKAFETMRSYSERSKYLVTTQAKIIAMTCTHAALKRHEFIKQGFEFDTVRV